MARNPKFRFSSEVSELAIIRIQIANLGLNVILIIWMEAGRSDEVIPTNRIRSGPGSRTLSWAICKVYNVPW